MANGLRESLQGISRDVGAFAREKIALQQAQAQRQQRLADQMTLLKAKSKIEQDALQLGLKQAQELGLLASPQSQSFQTQRQQTQPPEQGVVNRFQQPQQTQEPQRQEVSPFIFNPVSQKLVPNPRFKAEQAEQISQRRSDIIEERGLRKESRKLSKELEDVTGQISIIEGDIDELFGVFNKIPDKFRGPIQGRTTGAFFGGFLQQSPNLVQYEDSKQFFLSNISRKLGGERGVLTDRDIERVDKLFPQLRDKDEVAKGKISRIKQFISRRVNEHRARLQKQIKRTESVGRFEPAEEDLSDLSVEELQAILNE